MRLFAAALLAGLAAAPEAGAFSPQTCVYRTDDGRVTTARLFQPEWRFAEPTEDYTHAVLGDGIEYRVLEVVRFPASRTLTPPEGVDTSNLPEAPRLSVRLPETRVFEDLAPRVFEWTPKAFHQRSGIPELGLSVFVVETDVARGASLAVYDVTCEGVRKIAATAPIGRAFRWLAPVGAGDFDGDGRNDIAYVETPHLDGRLKIVTLRDGELVPIAAPFGGVTNHRIGEDFITSGVRECSGLAEAVVADKGWTTLMAVRLEDGRPVSRPLDLPPTSEGIAEALRCG